MNPMTNIKNLQKLNEKELELGIIGKKSWHDEYKASAWIFTGGLPYDLTEGDIICVFSQYGEIMNINLVRDSKTGKSKGYAFICFQDQRSTVLTVDNLNGIKILGRTIRVDHVKDYKMPKERGDEDDVTLKLRQDGCAPRIEESPPHGEEQGVAEETVSSGKKKKEKKKKVKKEKKMKKRKRHSSDEEESKSNSSDQDAEDSRSHHPHSSSNMDENIHVKEEKKDNGYDKALNRPSARADNNAWRNDSRDTARGDNFDYRDIVKKEERRKRDDNDEERPYSLSGSRRVDSDRHRRRDRSRSRSLDYYDSRKKKRHHRRRSLSKDR